MVAAKPTRSTISHLCVVELQEDQVHKVRTSNSIKFQQLEATIQDKLELAQTRREQIEQEQKKKLRNHVSLRSYAVSMSSNLIFANSEH